MTGGDGTRQAEGATGNGSHPSGSASQRRGGGGGCMCCFAPPVEEEAPRSPGTEEFATPDLRRLNSPVPPTLGEMRGSSMARSVRAVSMRLSRAISSIFYDAEAPDEEQEQLFFRFMSRRVSARSSARAKKAWTRRSLRNLGLEALEDSDIEPNFVRIAKGDMVEARRMFVAFLKWRKEAKIDTILLEPHHDFEQILEASPHFLMGRSKDGGLISYEMNGRTDPGLMSKYKIKLPDIGRHSATIMEYCKYELYGGSSDGHYYAVFDLKGMTLAKASSPLLLQILRTYAETLTNYYPDILRKVLVVNPPFGAATIIKILRAVLPKDFNERIIICNSHKDLLEYIDPEVLWVEYGGKNTKNASTAEEWQGLVRMLKDNREGRPNNVYARNSKAHLPGDGTPVSGMSLLETVGEEKNEQ